jgi:hypothetical protein
VNCERQWDQFLHDIQVDGASFEDMRRYIRVNPDIGRPPPRLDARDDIAELQRDVNFSLRTGDTRLMLRTIVHRLIASSFYFERTHAIRNDVGKTITVTGMKPDHRLVLQTSLLQEKYYVASRTHPHGCKS